MEIKRVGENKIRCALTETEIRELGFDIEEIIGDSETTQKFMRVVLSIVEEKEHINLEDISPMVKAELLQDHTMAITFGGDSDVSLKSLLDKMNHLMSQMKGEKPEEAPETEREKKQADVSETMICALRFRDIESLIGMSKVCFTEKLPKSSLYKLEDAYYAVLDFSGFVKEEMRAFAFGAVEYDDAHYSEPAQIAYIREHGKNIIKNDALQMLMQL